MAFSPRTFVFLSLTVLLSISASAPSRDRTAPQFATAPAVLKNPNPEVPLTRIITFSTNEPAMAAIEINGGRPIVVEDARAMEHFVPVLGLHAGAVNRLRIILTDDTGNTSPPKPRIQRPLSTRPAAILP